MLRKVEDYVREHLSEEITVENLAELVELNAFHFSRVFNHGPRLWLHQRYYSCGGVAGSTPRASSQ